MEEQVFDFLEYWMRSCLGLFTRLLDEIPIYGQAIMWVVFVMLVMNLIVIPIRGAGMSDRALAEDVRAGRALSTKQMKVERAKGAYLRDRSYRRATQYPTRPRSFDDF